MTVVVWHDAHATLEELNELDIKKGHRPNVIHTSGYVIISDPEGVSIAGEWLPANSGEDYETYRSITFIPRSLVQSVGTAKRTKKAANRGKATDLPRELGGVGSPTPGPDSQSPV